MVIKTYFSKNWGAVCRAFLAGGKQHDVDETIMWAKHVILSVWDYASSLWKYCNAVVYRATKEQLSQKALLELQAQVTATYWEFSEDPFIVSSKFNFLSLSKKDP
jgi:hypothetical protein